MSNFETPGGPGLGNGRRRPIPTWQRPRVGPGTWRLRWSGARESPATGLAGSGRVYESWLLASMSGRSLGVGRLGWAAGRPHSRLPGSLARGALRGGPGAMDFICTFTVVSYRARQFCAQFGGASYFFLALDSRAPNMPFCPRPLCLVEGVSVGFACWVPFGWLSMVLAPAQGSRPFEGWAQDFGFPGDPPSPLGRLPRGGGCSKVGWRVTRNVGPFPVFPGRPPVLRSSHLCLRP